MSHTVELVNANQLTCEDRIGWEIKTVNRPHPRETSWAVGNRAPARSLTLARGIGFSSWKRGRGGDPELRWDEQEWFFSLFSSLVPVENPNSKVAFGPGWTIWDKKLEFFLSRQRSPGWKTETQASFYPEQQSLSVVVFVILPLFYKNEERVYPYSVSMT